MRTLKKVSTAGILVLVILSFSLSLDSSHALGVAEETVVRRNLVIDLGDGLTTDAQLTFPAVGDGPFPGVLLVHGSGPIDMDAYIPPEVAPAGKAVRLFLQITEYLSERGFAVLRYNKRGIGLNSTVLDRNVYGNMTFQDLVQDAEKAVGVLRLQPEVDATDITIIGHSEGTWIAPRIAIKDSSTRNIVLMSAGAHSLYDILCWQAVSLPISFSEDALDTNHDGLLSVQEVLEAQRREELPPQAFLQNGTGKYDWNPGLDANKDGYLGIQEELKPLLVQIFNLMITSDPTSRFYDRWLQSQLALKDTNLALIGNVFASILILQGERDIQTPVEEAFLLEQRLTEIRHPDHTLITYPGLGHSFYPAKGLIQPLGPIQNHVLSDLAAWLKDPARKVRYKTSELESQVKGLERRNRELQLALDSSTNLAYIAIGIAIIAVAGVAFMAFRRRQSLAPRANETRLQ